MKRRSSSTVDSSRSNGEGEVGESAISKKPSWSVVDAVATASPSVSGSPSAPPPDIETDVFTLDRRLKQIEYGKNTAEYIDYLNKVPRQGRQQFHPKTPNMHRKFSRRAWDGLIRQWRMNLHCWSQNGGGGTNGTNGTNGTDMKMELGASATLSDSEDFDNSESESATD